jgi:rod shape-determining protein MreD
MARLLFGLLLFATVFAQSTFLSRLNPFQVTPDLVLVLLFLWAAHHSVCEALLWVFITGIVIDVIAIDPLGANGLALVIVVVLSHPMRIRPWQFNLMSAMLLVMLATVIHGVILYTLRGISISSVIAIQAVIHALLAPLIYLSLRLIGR